MRRREMQGNAVGVSRTGAMPGRIAQKTSVRFIVLSLNYGCGRSIGVCNGVAMKLYRYLTGPDDDGFCHRVTAALNNGWQLYGNPTLAYDGNSNTMICGQAIIKEVPGEYRSDLQLSEQ